MSKFTNIEKIESAKENEIVEIAIEKHNVKGYNVYLVDLEGYFGYSRMIYKDGAHIYYLNDYELHHNGKSREELHDMYLNSIKRRVFTDEEIGQPLKDYDEYRMKSEFLTNHYGMQKPHVSMFCIIRNDDEEKAYDESVKGMIRNPIAFAYYHKEDEDFVKHHIELREALEKAYSETETNYEYQKAAFKYEMANHEYHINSWQGDYDTLSAFGNVQWHGEENGAETREMYFDDLGFNDIQRKAYRDAIKEYYAELPDDAW